MNFIADNKEYFFAVTIPLTVIAVVASTAYMLRNILRLGTANNVTSVDVSPVKSAAEDFGIVKSEDIHGVSVNQAGDNGFEDKDPVQYCEHIQSEVKKARQRVATREIQQNLTDEDLMNEREIQRKQLEQIFKLMEQNNDKFGAANVDDIQEQMKLYA